MPFSVRRSRWSSLWRPLWGAYRLWLQSDCIDLSAAFAYHCLQSFVPVLLIALSIASRILGRDPGLSERLIEFAEGILPSTALPFLEVLVQKFTRQGPGAGIFGLVFLLLSAGNIYLTLQRGMDRVWGWRHAGLEGLPWNRVIWRFLALRFKAFLMITVLAVLIVLDQLVNNFNLLVLKPFALPWLPPLLHRLMHASFLADLGLSGFIGLICAWAALWILPSRLVPAPVVLPGAALGAAALMAMNLFLGRILLSLGVRFQAFGLVGGVLVLTLWIWSVGVVLYYSQCLNVVLWHARKRSGPLLVP
ncbi:MAG: YihY/virulence factor BrkB family protein [Synechococcus sp.]|nr:YihY/virulence factor BrkB family protein [Synechococcus sp.]